MKQTKQAFTLVELIVVITILAILWTIAFISFQWYSSQSRDSVRIANLSNLHKWLEIFQINSWKYPLPDGYVEITSSWSIIWYQWFAKQNVERISEITQWSTQDPLKDSIYTTYTTNLSRNKLQLMVFLESSENSIWYKSIIEKTNANLSTDYSKRTLFSRWDDIWILLWNTWSTLKQPIQETWTWIDVFNTQTEYKIYFDEDYSITWTWNSLKVLKSIMNAWKIATSCKDYINTYSSFIWEDWKYIINPTLGNKLEVYCDMTTDWWGWTLITAKAKYGYLNSWLSSIDNINKKYIDYSYIRWNYVSPMWKELPLIYRVYNNEEWNHLLFHDSVYWPINIDREKIDIHYQTSQDFANAFIIWEKNTSWIDESSFKIAVWKDGAKKITWRKGVSIPQINYITRWSAWWDSVHNEVKNNYLRFPMSPYDGTWRLWNETFESSYTWTDWRSISIWVK